MRKAFVTALTILAGAHNAAVLISQDTLTPWDGKTTPIQYTVAQGYGYPGWGYPRERSPYRPYEYDRPYGPREGYITPEDRYGNMQRRWEFRDRYRYQRGPYYPW